MDVSCTVRIFEGFFASHLVMKKELVGVSGDHLTSRNGARNLLNGNQPKIDIEITSIDFCNGNIYIVATHSFLT